MEYNWQDKKIVVVEDVQINFILIKRLLRNTGAEVVWLENGQEAVDFFKEGNEADLVLMDIRMPVMNGIDATKLIKSYNPNVIVIIQTACVVVDSIEGVEESNCDDYIFKPIIAENFFEKLSQYLS